jgi:hypothetical protein
MAVAIPHATVITIDVDHGVFVESPTLFAPRSSCKHAKREASPISTTGSPLATFVVPPNWIPLACWKNSRPWSARLWA